MWDIGIASLFANVVFGIAAPLGVHSFVGDTVEQLQVAVRDL